MGIGAGWYEHEYEGYGYEFPKASIRIGMLGEAVEIMQRMWTEDEVHFDGKYYKLDGAINQPKPLQTPHIPFWSAGGGENLTLRIAAEYAAYTNFGNTVDNFNHKSDVLRGHCSDVGANFDAITRTTNFHVVCAESEAAANERLAWIEDRISRVTGEPDRGARAAELYRPMTGTPDQLIERLRPWADAGAGYGILYFAEAATDTSGISSSPKKSCPL